MKISYPRAPLLETYFPTYGGRTKIMRFIIERGRTEREREGEKKEQEEKGRKKRKKEEARKVNKGDEGKEKTAREIKGKLESKISRNIKGVR